MRLDAGLTQEELALKCGLSQGYINQLESGKRRFTQKSLDIIADTLSIPLMELFRRKKSNSPLLSVRILNDMEKGVLIGKSSWHC